MTKKKIDFIPNSTTFPNSYIDKIMYLLDGDEWKTFVYFAGHKDETVAQVAKGSGVGISKTRKSLALLKKCGIIINSDIEQNIENIKTSFLKVRLAKKKSRNSKKMEKVRPAQLEPILKRLSKRDGFFCQKCGTKNNLTVDHIIPKSIGGSNKIGNLQILCMACNNQKGNRSTIDYRGTTK